MTLKTLSEEEFQTFANTAPLANFHQTTAWARLKGKNGWKSHFVGLMKEDKILAGALLLSKKTPLGKRMFYSPRGFLLDFNNKELLESFTKEIKQYMKKENGIFLKVDPYLDYVERNRMGEIVPNGQNNKTVVTNLNHLGYRHFGFNLMQETLQPRWIYTLEVKDRSIEDLMNDMDPKTRQIIRKNEKSAIHTREIGLEELATFKDIMKHTSDRRDFVDRPFEYYKNMWETLHEDKMIKVILAELNTVELLKTLNDEKDSYQKAMAERLYKKENSITKMNETKFEQKQKEEENNIARVAKKIEEIKDLKEKHGDCIVLGGILFLIYGTEVLSLVGGSYQEFMTFQSAYTLHWEMIKYARENGYERYNFYGITGDFQEKNPLNGLYLFKSSFGGKVNELIGEFDYVVSKPYYFLYKTSFSFYRTIKNTMHHFKK